MTHYEIDYSALSGPARQEKALADIKSYLGAAKYDELVAELKGSQPISFGNFVMQLAFFAGIEGVPVQELYLYIWPDETAQVEAWKAKAQE